MVHCSKSYFYCSLCQTQQNATAISTIKSIHHYWYYFILVCQLYTIEDKSVGTLEHLQPLKSPPLQSPPPPLPNVEGCKKMLHLPDHNFSINWRKPNGGGGGGEE